MFLQALGEPPWPEERIRDLYFRDFRALDDAMKQHPGHALSMALRGLRCSLDVANDAEEDLLAEFASFKAEALEGGMFTRRNRGAFEARVRRIRKAFFTAVSSAWSLVDHCRQVTNRVEVPELSARLAQAFDPGMHEFMRCVRQCAAHVAIPDPGWRMSFDAAGLQVGFVLRPADLPIEGNVAARRFADTHGVLDVEDLIRRYSSQVKHFYDWFLPEAEIRGGEPLHDYHRCLQLVRQIGFRSEWDAWLHAEPNDPESVRNRFIKRLTFGEARQVLRLPHGSVEQAQRVIELLDEEHHLDEGRRRATHQRFGVVE